MLEWFQFVAILTCGLFSGAALYINVAEHPARMQCGTELAATVFGPSYHRAAALQAPLALVAALTPVLGKRSIPSLLENMAFQGEFLPLDERGGFEDFDLKNSERRHFSSVLVSFHMNIEEYAKYDALGLAELVSRKQVSPKELAETAAWAMEAINPAINAVVETYRDRIDSLDEKTLGDGPFRGVPFLMKDVFGHEAGRKIDFGSRLCKGMIVQADTHYCQLLRASGVNILGRSAAPEYSMSGTTEGALYGNTSTPWKRGYSAGGSTGGGMAAVVAGLVPIVHGSDIAGSIRVPASFCGGVGLKPSRGRISFGPILDENGYGLAQNFVQTKTVRDCAAMLDCLAVPQPGDPFIIPKPPESYMTLLRKKPPRLRIGWSTKALMNIETDKEVAQAVERTAETFAQMGHEVSEDSPEFDPSAMTSMADVWFFGFDHRLEGYSKRTGRPIGPETIEPVVLMIYEYARQMKPAQFMNAMAALNTARRRLGHYFTKYDVWLSPTTARVAEPWGKYNLGRTDVTMDTLSETIFQPVFQFTLPHNITGTPAISLPLAMHSSALPIGVQLGTAPAAEHLILQLAAALEEAMPWKDRLPPLHISCVSGRKHT